MKIRLRIADLMILVAIVAAGAFIFRFDRDLFAVAVWAFSLGALGICTVIARIGNVAGARFALGFAVFGWTWLACGLRFGFLPTNELLLQHSAVGFGVGLLSGYAAHRLVPSAA
jgi:hypothetical protein